MRSRQRIRRVNAALRELRSVTADLAREGVCKDAEEWLQAAIDAASRGRRALVADVERRKPARVL